MAPVSGNHLPNPIPPRVRPHSSPGGFRDALSRDTHRNVSGAPFAARWPVRRTRGRRPGRCPRRPRHPTARETPPPRPDRRPASRNAPLHDPSEPALGRRIPRPLSGHRSRIPDSTAAAAEAGSDGPATTTRTRPARAAPSQAGRRGGRRASTDRGEPTRAGSRAIHRAADRFPRPHAHLFSQLSKKGLTLPRRPPIQAPTCMNKAARAPRTLRGQATTPRRTSQRRPRVQRFVIECFTPSCHVDNVRSAEPAIRARRDTVDSILTVHGGGPVQDRGETCRSDITGEPRPSRGA